MLSAKLNNEQLKTFELLTTWTWPLRVWRIHTSIYDSHGTLVSSPCECEAIEHLCVTCEIKSDQKWFDEIFQCYVDDGLSELDAWDRASEGFHFVNGSDPIDISDWKILPATHRETKVVEELVKLYNEYDIDYENVNTEMIITILNSIIATQG